MLISMKKIESPSQGGFLFSYFVVFLFLIFPFFSVSYSFNNSLLEDLSPLTQQDIQNLDTSDLDSSDTLSSDTHTVSIQLQGQGDNTLSEDNIRDDIEHVAREKADVQLSLEQIHQNLEALKEDVTKVLYDNGYTAQVPGIGEKAEKIFERLFESSSSSYEQDPELDLVYRIFAVEQQKLNEKFKEDGVDDVLKSMDSSRSIFEQQLDDGTKYKVSMFVLTPIDAETKQQSKAVLMYIRLPDRVRSGVQKYSQRAYSILIPLEENDDIEDLSSQIVSEAVLKQQIDSIETYLSALEHVDFPDPEAKEHIDQLKGKAVRDMKEDLTRLSMQNREALKIKRAQFEKLIEKRDSTQRTLNQFNITHLIYSANSNILVPISETHKISLLNYFKYVGHRFKGAYGKPDYVTGLLSASFQVGILLFLSNFGVPTDAKALLFQFTVAASIGVFGPLYRGIMDVAPDDANHSHLKYLILRVLKDFVITAVTLYPYMYFCGKWKDAATKKFFYKSFLGPSVVSKALGDYIMFFPRVVKDLTGEKYTKPIKYMPGFTLYNLGYQLYYALTKFAPKKFAELGKKDVNILGHDIRYGIITMVLLGMICHTAVNPIIMSSVETHYMYKFFVNLRQDIQKEDIPSLAEKMREAIANHSLHELEPTTGSQADSIRKYSKLVKYFSRSAVLTGLDLRYFKITPRRIAAKRSQLQQEQVKLLDEMQELFKHILDGVIAHHEVLPAIDDPRLFEEEIPFVTKKLMKRLKPYADPFIAKLKRYDSISLYIEKLNQIESEGSLLPRTAVWTKNFIVDNARAATDAVNDKVIQPVFRCVSMFTKGSSSAE